MAENKPEDAKVKRISESPKSKKKLYEDYEFNDS